MLLPPLPAFLLFSEWTERNTTEAWGNGRMVGWARELELTSQGILGTGTRLLTSFLLVHLAFARNKMPILNKLQMWGREKVGSEGGSPISNWRAGHGMGQLLTSGPYCLNQVEVPTVGTGTGSPGCTESS